jgi:hypothetical protein
MTGRIRDLVQRFDDEVWRLMDSEAASAEEVYALAGALIRRATVSILGRDDDAAKRVTQALIDALLDARTKIPRDPSVN